VLKAKGWLLSAALVVVTALPAAAQDLGVGVSFLGDEGGTGFIVDYSGPLQRSMGRHQLNWLVDFSWHRNSFGGDAFGADYDFTQMLVTVGARIKGQLNDKTSWHAQGAAGIVRGSASVDAAGATEDLCDLLDIDCDAGSSDTSGLINIGGALAYALSDSGAVRAQLDIPIALGDGGDSTTRFSIMYVLKLGGN
jgi:hypothetical protein